MRGNGQRIMTISGVTPSAVVRVGNEVRWSARDESKFSSTDATIKIIAAAVQSTLADWVKGSDGHDTEMYPQPEWFSPLIGRVKGWELLLPGTEKGSQVDLSSGEVFPMIGEGIEEASEIIDVIRGVGNEVYRHKRGRGLVRVSHLDGSERGDPGPGLSELIDSDEADVFAIKSPLADRLVSKLMKRRAVRIAISLEERVLELTTPEGKSDLVAESECYRRLAWVLAIDITQARAIIGFLDKQGEVVEASCRVSSRHLSEIEQHGGRIFKVEIRACRRQGSEVGQAPVYYILEEAELASDREAMSVQETADTSRQLYLTEPRD